MIRFIDWKWRSLGVYNFKNNVFIVLQPSATLSILFRLISFFKPVMALRSFYTLFRMFRIVLRLLLIAT